MKFLIRHSAFILLLLTIAATTGYSQDPSLEKKLYPDSTIFKLKLEPNSIPKAGNSFKVRIHVIPGKHYHIWSSKMSNEGGLVPLTLKVPSTIARYFAITDIKEISK